jgi:hypothetical protein
VDEQHFARVVQIAEVAIDKSDAFRRFRHIDRGCPTLTASPLEEPPDDRGLRRTALLLSEAPSLRFALSKETRSRPYARPPEAAAITKSTGSENGSRPSSAATMQATPTQRTASTTRRSSGQKRSGFRVVAWHERIIYQRSRSGFSTRP